MVMNGSGIAEHGSATRSPRAGKSDAVGLPLDPVVLRAGRGSDANYLAPPAQIRTCSFPAYGSYLGSRRQTLAVCAPAPVTRLPGSASGTCFAGSHSPWSPPFAPLAPLQLPPPRIAPQGAPLCSPASQLLWRSPTSHARASSATAPHLPDADQVGTWPVVRRGISQVPARSVCA